MSNGCQRRGLLLIQVGFRLPVCDFDMPMTVMGMLPSWLFRLQFTLLWLGEVYYSRLHMVRYSIYIVADMKQATPVSHLPYV